MRAPSGLLPAGTGLGEQLRGVEAVFLGLTCAAEVESLTEGLLGELGVDRTPSARPLRDA
ncbi:hypothetical protein [Streptomyces sp. NBC_00459]|uniref:hypothetical protein n=1 Tax=Streptomyces sp. NBC_00459 TaxID=2975749 RepID=UPI002E19D0D9